MGLLLSQLGGDLFDDGVHLVQLLFHVGHQLDLGPGPDQIVFGVGDLEVDVAVQVGFQEPGGLLQGDGVGAQGQSLDLLAPMPSAMCLCPPSWIR